MDTLSDHLRNGIKIWAICKSLPCSHRAELGLQALIDHPKIGDVSILTLKHVGILRCARCGSRGVHLNIQPPVKRRDNQL